MRILYLCHYAGSLEMGMAFRPYYFSREWVRMGHDVTMIAADYSHLRRVNPDVQHDFQMQDIDGIHYCWIKTGRYEGNGVKRAVTMAKFVGKLWLKAKWIAQTFRPDAIICSSTYPIDTYAGQRIKKYCGEGCELIHEVHDMWPLTPVVLGGMSRHNPFIVVMQMGENSFCKHADKVVSLLPCADGYLEEHGMAADKFYSVPNGIVREEWDSPEPVPAEHEQAVAELRRKYKFVIGFFGSVITSYGLIYLIDAVKNLEQGGVCAVIVGDGRSKADLMKHAAGAENIRFLPLVPKRSIPSFMPEMDALYVGALRTELEQYGICMNKLFDSMMSGVPILYAAGAPNNYILEYGCGVSVEQESASALEGGIRQLIAMTPEERAQMGARGTKAVLEHFEYSVLAKQFIDIICPEENLAAISDTNAT